MTDTIQNIYDPLNHREMIIRVVRERTNNHVSPDLAMAIADDLLPFITTAAPTSNAIIEEIEGMIEIGERSGIPVAQGTALAARDALALVGATRAENAALGVILQNFRVPVTGYLADLWRAFCEDRDLERTKAKAAVAAAEKRAEMAEVKAGRRRYLWRTYVLERGLVGVLLSSIFGDIHEKRGVFNLMFIVAVVGLIGMVILAT
jgi:hypothetical protein